MKNLKTYRDLVRDWEYCYCQKCQKIKYSFELEATDSGIRCSHCGSYDLEPPGWIKCPYEKTGAVKCARAGKGVAKGTHGQECTYRCNFRQE